MKRLSRFLAITCSVGIVAAGAYAAFDQRRITLESEGRREYRRVDHDGYVRLSRRLSDAPCIQGRSWGFDRNGIWVDDGCRAVFEIGRNNGRNDRWDDRDRRDREDKWYSRDTFKLESEDGRRETKRIDTRGGVRLLRQLSDSRCVYGRSWGYDRDRVWVDDGCRAIFEVGNGNGGYGGGGYGGGGYGGGYGNDDRYTDNCPTWLPGRYSGYDNGRRFQLTIDRGGRVSLQRDNNGRWGDEERGFYRDDAIHVGSWVYGVSRENDGVCLRSRSNSRYSINLRKL